MQVTERSDLQAAADALVGRSFNPSGREDVDKLKSIFAEALVIVSAGQASTDNGSRVYEAAIQAIITAQMWAVKSITFTTK